MLISLYTEFLRLFTFGLTPGQGHLMCFSWFACVLSVLPSQARAFLRCLLETGLQMANAAELEACKEDVAALKKLCRQRTLAVWKAWRADMEADKAKLLQVGRCWWM